MDHFNRLGLPVSDRFERSHLAGLSHINCLVSVHKYRLGELCFELCQFLPHFGLCSEQILADFCGKFGCDCDFTLFLRTRLAIKSFNVSFFFIPYLKFDTIQVHFHFAVIEPSESQC